MHVGGEKIKPDGGGTEETDDGVDEIHDDED